MTLTTKEKALFQQAVSDEPSFCNIKNTEKTDEKAGRAFGHTYLTHSSNSDSFDEDSISFDIQSDSEKTRKNRHGALIFCRSGVNRSTIKQWNKSPKMTLDVHGMTRSQASIAVQHLLKRAQVESTRSITIIHGHGQRRATGAILRQHLRGELSCCKFVLAMRNASGFDESAGATEILLKLS